MPASPTARSRCTLLALALALALAACGGGSPASDAAVPSDAGETGDTGVPADMIAIAAGTFMMGCDRTVDLDCAPDESPQHAVTLSAYAIDRNEVTRDQYATCVTAGACTAPTDTTAFQADHPVVQITHDQAAVYCASLGRRLPTEAEWERAARGTDGRIYPWGGDPPDCDHANSYGCTGATDAVGSHPSGASATGALDMAGNAEEWVSDWYDPLYYDTSPSSDPPGPTSGPYHVRRGGSFDYITTFLRGSSRGDADPEGPQANLGVRCAMSIGPQPDAGPPVDAGASDAGASDAGASDAATSDGAADAGAIDDAGADADAAEGGP